MVQFARSLLDGTAVDRENTSAKEQRSATDSAEDNIVGDIVSPILVGAQLSSRIAEAGLLLPEKRVSNAKMKGELGVVLRFPTYKEGLRAIHAGDQTPFD